MSISIFYKPIPEAVPVQADASRLGVDEYCWTERSRSVANRLAREHARHRRAATIWCALVCMAPVSMGAAVFPRDSHVSVTKRVYWPECVPMLTIYGKRCN
jgi:hypothetical protein